MLYPSWHATILVIEPFRCQFTVATSNKRRNLLGSTLSVSRSGLRVCSKWITLNYWSMSALGHKRTFWLYRQWRVGHLVGLLGVSTLFAA